MCENCRNGIYRTARPRITAAYRGQPLAVGDADSGDAMNCLKKMAGFSDTAACPLQWHERADWSLLLQRVPHGGGEGGKILLDRH